jgi:hypothetical protein
MTGLLIAYTIRKSAFLAKMVLGGAVGAKTVPSNIVIRALESIEQNQRKIFF